MLIGQLGSKEKEKTHRISKRNFLCRNPFNHLKDCEELLRILPNPYSETKKKQTGCDEPTNRLYTLLTKQTLHKQTNKQTRQTHL